MKLTTASQVVSFAIETEYKIEAFYKKLAEKYKDQSEVFTSFAKESMKNKTVIQRTYQGVVSDALETGYSFEEFVVDDFIPDISVPEKASLFDVAKRALQVEEKIQKFYRIAAQMSGGLLADVPQTFERIASRIDKRKESLKSLFK